jgi:hypothetical protein
MDSTGDLALDPVVPTRSRDYTSFAKVVATAPSGRATSRMSTCPCPPGPPALFLLTRAGRQSQRPLNSAASHRRPTGGPFGAQPVREGYASMTALVFGTVSFGLTL